MLEQQNIYIISDLHLSGAHPSSFNILKNFLLNISNKDNTLFILGDFFDYWVGDDDLDNFHKRVINVLKKATNSGLKIFFMHGNRDFLVGKHFANLTNVKLISDPYYININDRKIMLTHGDLLCTDDLSYSIFRSIVRTRIFKRLFLLLPLKFRRYLASRTRKVSYRKNIKSPNIDVTKKGLNKYLKDSNIIIHGHTHKMHIYEGKKFTRYVLGAWYKNGSFVKISENNIYLHTLIK